jgi:hypothetical protein
MPACGTSRRISAGSMSMRIKCGGAWGRSISDIMPVQRMYGISTRVPMPTSASVSGHSLKAA